MATNATPAPEYVQEWAKAAKQGSALRPFVRQRYWERAGERAKFHESDFDVSLRALDHLIAAESAMVRKGAWALLEEHARVPAAQRITAADDVIAWVRNAVLLPVHWSHFPHVGHRQLRDNLEKVLNHAKVLRADLESRQFGAQVAFKHAGLVTVDDLVALHRLRIKSAQKDWRLPPVDLLGFFDGYRPLGGDVTLLDLLETLIAGLGSRLEPAAPWTVEFPGQFERSRRKKGGNKTAASQPPSDRKSQPHKSQPQYMRRNFLLRSLKVISEGHDIAFDEYLIAACARDLLTSVGDHKAALDCTATYLRKFFGIKQGTLPQAKR